MKLILALVTILYVASIVPSCTNSGKSVPEIELIGEDDIATTDSLFSEMSQSQGLKAAMLFYMEDNAVIIRPNSNTLIGADAVNFLSELNDTDFKMTWKANRTIQSTGSDLGYAYGTYRINSAKIDSILTGTYVHVWKKVEDGTWKFVLNSWNETVEE